MADVLDVAQEILRVKGPMSTFRLQKLVYYSQAYHVAKHGQPLFSAPIEAWVNGPAVPRLHQEHRGNFEVATVNGDPTRLSHGERQSIERALRFYGDHDSRWLVTQTHMEPPWVDARVGLGPSQRGSNLITPEALQRYFGKIFNDPEAENALTDAQKDSGHTPGELFSRPQ
jgi:uncharacterized phage-associated protein